MAGYSVVDMSTVSLVEGLLQQVCDDYAFSSLRDSQLQQALIRDVTSRLNTLQQKGLITRHVVRCDDETNDGDPSRAVVEVALRLPKRVQYVTIRCGFSPGG